MQHKKRTNTTKKRNNTARNVQPCHRRWMRIISWIGIFAIIGIIAIVWWQIAAGNDHETKLVGNATTPGTASFYDDNTMFFATNNSLPEPNNARELSAPASVIISYDVETGPYAPAFKMNINNSDLSDKIKITPFIRGNWYLRGNSAVMFTPDAAWPADTKFTVKFDSDMFNDDVDIDNMRVSFTTPTIAATVENFNLYPATDNKQSVIGIAVISFNYEIDTTNFADKISLRLDGEKLGFNIKFDRFRRTAFIISDAVKITDDPQNMRLKLNRVSAISGDSKTEKVTANVTIESADNIFKISSLETIVANNNDGNAQQLILLNTTSAAKSNTNWSEYISAYLLPKYRDSDEQENNIIHTWANDEITDQVISESKKLTIKPMDFATPNGIHQYAFAYDVSDQDSRYIYVKITPGAQSNTGFTMKNGLSSVMRVPYPEQSVQIAGSGALLSLAGKRELGIVARGGVDTAYVNLYKVKSSEINHLISQTYNVFAQNMEFKSWSFDAYDMSVVFQKRIAFSNTSKLATNYASVDLGDYLDRTYGDNTGIFIIQTGTTENSTDYGDKRLILLTDLGIIRKTNLDGSSNIFVSNLGAGTPAGDVEISILGRNGNAIWAGRTDANGHAEIPAFPWSEYKNAREPVAIVARRNNDISFIPYNAYNQRVEYSKFDIDGTYSQVATPLNAFVFSDRGIYRPGEKLFLSGIVKNKSFDTVSGIPVRIQVYDSRGRVALEHSFSLTADGMFNAEYDIPTDASLGSWTAYLYSLTSTDKLNDMLGMANFEVQEFTPDTMKITANIMGASENGGWISPDNLSATVSLRNLFGTPAANRKITAHATLTPIQYSFKNFDGYQFTPNFISGTGLSENTVARAQTYSTDIPEIYTDSDGNANLDIQFNRDIPSGTYNLTLHVNGFELNSGRSVQTNIATRASNEKYLIGWHADGDMDYINRNTTRKINFVAIDHTATPTTANDLTIRLVKQETQTTLVKDYNNIYKYQTTTHDKIISQNPINIPTDGTTITLDTSTSGTYVLQVLDASNKILANAKYFVAGTTNDTLQTDTNADLQIKLNSSEYAPGADIEISITAPYSGAGLITIERDKVYAYKWFRTTSASSIQHITVPNDFAGTGYVNVSFVRDINSRDIFTTPYAYAVAPFSANTSAHKINVKLTAPDTVRDNKLAIQYTTNKNARLMIFAVNTGILQVANYQIPNPLAHFFQKSALQVDTFQILSLLLPEYNVLREYAKTGGGDFGGGSALEPIVQNPFARSTLPPVAFYSGIVDARANATGTVNFDIPEYFNGELTIFAVAANTTSVGSSDTTTLVQSPIVISTSAPLMAAPGDEFEINSVVTNMTDIPNANTSVTVTATGGIKIAAQGASNANIPTNGEHLFTFPATAGDTLGNSDLIVTATTSDKSDSSITRTSHTTLSVRPATTYQTKIKSDMINSPNFKISDFYTPMYPEYATRRLYISSGTDAMILPLFEYLAHYEYPCTEQLVSRAMPYAIMPSSQILGTTFQDSEKHILETINTLKNRQNNDGSFALWAGDANNGETQYSPDTANLTAYVTEFLTIARDAGFDIPHEMLSRAVDYLRTFAGGTITDPSYARAAARAIYVISENDYVTTSYIDSFTQYANESMKDWESDVTGAYIAAAYKIMKQDDQARDLIAKYKLSSNPDFEYRGLFDNNVANDAMYYYITRKYFTPQNPMESNTLRTYIAAGDYSAYTSAATIMAMAGTINNAKMPSITVTTNAPTAPIVKAQSTTTTVEIPTDATEIEINCPDCSQDVPLFFTLLQSGYPTESHPETHGIDITREYFDMDGNRINSANIGDTVTVKISARTRGDVNNADNVVITDLLPGGFIANPDSISGDMEYAQFREDRVLIFTDLNRDTLNFTYTAQIGAAGKFTVPPIAAQSMYNPSINARGDIATFTVINESVQ